MSEVTKSIMEEMYNRTLKTFAEGQIVQGTIVAKNNTEAIVDIGFKSEGFVPLVEFRNPSAVQVGQQIDVLIENIEDEDGKLILSHGKAEKMKGWQKIADVINEGDLVDGRVIRVVKGGYIADIRAWKRSCLCRCPRSKGSIPMPSWRVITSSWSPR